MADGLGSRTLGEVSWRLQGRRDADPRQIGSQSDEGAAVHPGRSQAGTRWTEGREGVG